MNRTEDVDFANAKDDIKEGKAEGCMKETHDAASPADSGVKMVSFRDDSAEAAASFHDEETQVTANTTKKDAIEKQPPRGAAAAAESTVKAANNTTVISSTKLNREKGIAYSENRNIWFQGPQMNTIFLENP